MSLGAQSGLQGPVRLLAKSLEQSAMLAWAKRGELRAVPAAPAVTAHSTEHTLHDGLDDREISHAIPVSKVLPVRPAAHGRRNGKHLVGQLDRQDGTG